MCREKELYEYLKYQGHNQRSKVRLFVMSVLLLSFTWIDSQINQHKYSPNKDCVSCMKVRCIYKRTMAKLEVKGQKMGLFFHVSAVIQSSID